MCDFSVFVVGCVTVGLFSLISVGTQLYLWKKIHRTILHRDHRCGQNVSPRTRHGQDWMQCFIYLLFWYTCFVCLLFVCVDNSVYNIRLEETNQLLGQNKTLRRSTWKSLQTFCIWLICYAGLQGCNDHHCLAFVLQHINCSQTVIKIGQPNLFICSTDTSSSKARFRFENDCLMRCSWTLFPFSSIKWLQYCWHQF